MALTTGDLKNIENLIERSVARLEPRFARIEQRFDALQQRVDRMETRLVLSIDLLQRGSSETLEDHERRIRRLEKLQTS